MRILRYMALWALGIMLAAIAAMAIIYAVAAALGAHS